MPSKAYHAAVAEGARHHASSKTYSGSLLRPHKPFLTELIWWRGCKSAVDVGCGKGRQWSWVDPADGMTMEQRWGFEVRKYDPCYPPYAEEPTGKYDLVICTHTAALIPLSDLDWFIERLFGFAERAVFIAEKLGERKKGEVADPDNRAIGWGAKQWLERVAPIAARYPNIETWMSFRHREPSGTHLRRHVWRAGRWFFDEKRSS